MLDFNSSFRITASEALDHDYFGSRKRRAMSAIEYVPTDVVLIKKKRLTPVI